MCSTVQHFDIYVILILVIVEEQTQQKKDFLSEHGVIMHLNKASLYIDAQNVKPP